ncbi:MAG: LppX_LprAFG lipoprotein [Anaerolineae bacterium]|nr:LppX_LprAFG lipoprotein [Anaerolineae bacterium]
MTRLATLLALLLIFTGCAPAPPPTDPLALIETAAEHIQAAETFAVSIERGGAPVYIDGNGVINFLRATGYYVAPDSVQARVRVLVSGIAGDIDVIAIGDDQFYRHAILTGGAWLNAEFSPGFNAEALVRSESGLARAMRAIKALTLEGTTSLDGIRMWHLTGTAVGSEVAALTIGLIPAQEDVEVSLYIRADTGQAERMVLVQPDTVSDTEPEPSTWTVEIYDYNGDYQIDAPGR